MMANTATDWHQVTKQEPCAICGKGDWCTVSDDGEVAGCMRTAEGSFKSTNGQYFHRLRESPKRSTATQAQTAIRETIRGKSFDGRDDLIRNIARQIDGELVGEWTYQHADGTEALRVCRFDVGDDKQFRPIHRNGEGWKAGDPPIKKLPLYRLPHLNGRKRKYVCEGEKAADAAVALGLPATTSAHGSKSASKSDWGPIADGEVIVLPDNDDAGATYARDVAREVMKVNSGAVVKIVHLPHLPHRGDIVEYIETNEDSEPHRLAATIEAMADQADPYTDANVEKQWPPIGVDELMKHGTLQTDWMWHGYVARQSITALIGLWKSGKTTLGAHLIAAIANGGGTVGTAVSGGSVLVVSEEPAAIWHERCAGLDINVGVSFILRPFKGRPTMATWYELIDELAAHAKAGRADLVVLDPWQSLNPCENENDAAEMMAALSPLHRVTEAGAGVLLLHHPRKGDGSEGQASRGSGALPGFVDVLAEFRRHNPEQADDTRRVLKAYSRYSETPAELVLDLTDDGYVAVGTRTEATEADRLDVIEQMLHAADKPLTPDAVFENWTDPDMPRPCKRSIRYAMNKGFQDDKWDRTGSGRRSDPYRYFPLPAPKTPHRAGNELQTMA